MKKLKKTKKMTKEELIKKYEIELKKYKDILNSDLKIEKEEWTKAFGKAYLIASFITDLEELDIMNTSAKQIEQTN